MNNNYIIFIVQTKYLALDFYEERKWKKACGFIIAQNAKKENEKKEKDNKIKYLFKKCYSLYMAINQNLNASELLLHNNNDRLDEYLHTNLNNDINKLIQDLYNWKKQIKDIETEIKEYIKIDDINEKKFIDIFSMINSLIDIQEDKIRKICDNKNSRLLLIAPRNLSHFTNSLNQSNQLNNISNQNYITLSNNSDINYNENYYNLKIIDKINKEFNGNMINNEKVNFNNSDKFKGNISSNNEQKSLEIIGNNSNNNNIIEMDIEDNINNELNSSSLFLDISDGISHKNLVEYLKNKTNFEICFSMPIFDLQKLMSHHYNLNKMEFDKKNIYFKMFPVIDNDENRISYKKIINEKDSKLKINIFEQITGYANLTPLQKLVIIYGIFTTGNNPTIIGFLLNSYIPTRCIIYNVDEMKFIAQNILDEIEIHYESNFTNANSEIINFQNKNSYYLGSTQKVEIESSFNMYKYNEFEYIDTIKRIMTCKNNDNDVCYYMFKNSKNRVPKTKNNNYNIYNKNISIQTSIFLIDIIIHNPNIINERIKRILLKKIINYLKKLCEVIKDIKDNNKSKYNYFTSKAISNNHKEINDINYEETKENKKKRLNKANILKSLREHKNKFKSYSIKQFKEKINKKKNIKTNIDNKLDKNTKTSFVDVINKYSEYNINKEWKSLKNIWYQNNNRLNPLFKVNESYEDYKINRNCNGNILNKKNLNEKEDTIKFCSILNLNINQ